jgi:hypothetical protein
MNAVRTGVSVLLLMSLITNTVVIDEGAFEHSPSNSVDYDFITISLGWNCQPAGFMRTHKLRFFAAPFDWCITPYVSLYNVIKSSFRNFLKKENLLYNEPHNSDR